MSDRFSGYAGSLDDPASLCRNVEPSDSVALSEVSRAIYVGGAGDLRLIDASGNTVTFRGVVGGSIVPVRTHTILASGTTATDLVAMS